MNHDSNMSDSQFMKFQNKLQEKMKKHIDNFDNENRIKLMKKRFESSKNRKKTVWEKIKSFMGIVVLIPFMITSAIGKEPTGETLNPITKFKMVTGDWEESIFQHGTDLSKYQHKKVDDIEVVFIKEYSGFNSMGLIRGFFPVDITKYHVLMGDKCPEDELKVFKDDKEVLDFRDPNISIADDKFNVKIRICNKKQQTYSIVNINNVKIVSLVHRKK